MQNTPINKLSYAFSLDVIDANHKKYIMKKITLSMLLLFVSVIFVGQSALGQAMHSITMGVDIGDSLSAGDVAFTAFNADGDDDFAIAALIDIPANTTLYFTDNEPNADGDGFIDFGEGTVQWESGASVISAGTIIVFTDTDNGSNTNFGASVGTLSVPSFDAGMNLAGGGDALYCVEGSPDGNNITAWLAGIQNETNNQGANFGATGLTVGTTFINFYLSGSPDGGEYNGARAGEEAFSDYLPLLGNSANWVTESSNGENILPISTVPFTLLTPPATTTWTGGNGTSAWTDPLNWDNGVPGTISTVNIPAPDAGVTIYPELTLAVTVAEIHILGNASGSGSILGNANLTVTGAPTFQRFVTGGTTTTTKDDPNALYHFISAPVFEPTAISLFPGTAYLREWNEATQEWINLEGSDVLKQNKGYTIWLPEGAATANYTGAWTSGDKVISDLTYTMGGPTPGFDGYNLVGNPYPSGLDWDQGSWTKTNIDATIAIWNGATGNYYYWNGMVGSIANGVIPPTQGFFVKASAAGPVLIIPESGRVNMGGPMYKDEVVNLLRIKVKASNAMEDELFINFNDDATTGYDAQYDGQKMYGLTAAPQIFTSGSDGVEMAINTLPYDEDGTLPLHVLCGEDASFTLLASDLESFNNGIAIYLEDMKTGGMINLMEQAQYNFDYSTNDDPVRFTLHFGVAFGTSELENQSIINVYAANHNIYLTSDEALQGEIQVFNLMGQQITTDRISGNTATINLSSAEGQYIVRVLTEDAVFTQKVFVK
jgi:hypothetical protein